MEAKHNSLHGKRPLVEHRDLQDPDQIVKGEMNLMSYLLRGLLPLGPKGQNQFFRQPQPSPICLCSPHQQMPLIGLSDLQLSKHQKRKMSPGPRDRLGQAGPDRCSPQRGPRGPKGQIPAPHSHLFSRPSS